MNLSITRPEIADKAELHRLFSIVITDAFREDGLDDPGGIGAAVKKQMEYMRQDLETDGSEVFFLIARMGPEIVGTIAHCEPSDLIKRHLKTDLRRVPEITTVYVLPELQRQGIGALLFNSIVAELKKKQFDEICLDGGYRKSQPFWIKKLGHPDVTLPDFWGKGLHHMIWRRKIGADATRDRIDAPRFFPT